MNSPFSPFVGRTRRMDFKRRQSQVPSDLIDWDAPEIPELEKQQIIYEQLLRETQEDHAIEMLINEEVYQVAFEACVEKQLEATKEQLVATKKEAETAQKQFEEKSQTDRSQINLLLGQIKMFESHSQELESSLKELEIHNEQITGQKQELEAKNTELQNQVQTLQAELNEHQKSVDRQIETLQSQIAEYQEIEANLKTLQFKVTEYQEIEARKDELENQIKQMEDREFYNQELEAENSCFIDMLIMRKSEYEDLKRRQEGISCRLSYYKKLAMTDVN